MKNRPMLFWAIVFFLYVCGSPLAASAADTPILADDRLTITLFAEDPEIVTPIGLAIDSNDAVFVIESHTHHPPSDYGGPKSDRIKVFRDDDRDGKADHSAVFAEGVHQAMNLAFSPPGDLFVVCAREVLQLIDQDGDGVCDQRRQVLRLETNERYAHNCLLGITYDRDGWMYVARGNTGSRYYRFRGADETIVDGYGDGGNVVRCRPDGAQLEELATGFWNPFDLKFDRNGRLLLVDNDPDARGPNRLLHVVRGGDYGYKSLYGGGGNHPFQGWDGTLPGSLPYIAGTGEAPSGLIDCRRSSLPKEYRHTVLTTIWNENSIERFELASYGASVAATPRQIFLSGGKEFRPVAIDCDSRGNLFVSDWVLVDYPNHGRGRIWRISNQSVSNRMAPEAYFDPPNGAPDSERLRRAFNAEIGELEFLLAADDPFIQHAAQVRLASPDAAQLRRRLEEVANPSVRLGALLAAKRAEFHDRESISKFLGDRDAKVRRSALQWAGESMDESLRPQLESALTAGPVDGPLFETYLAAVESISGRFAEAYRGRAQDRSNQIPRRLPPDVVLEVAKTESFDDSVRALAIGKLTDDQAVGDAQWLADLFQGNSIELSLAVARRCSVIKEPTVPALMEALTASALDAECSPRLRCEALSALSRSEPDAPERFVSLLDAPDLQVAIESARTIRAWLDAGKADTCIPLIRKLSLRAPVAERLAPARQASLFADFARPDRPDGPARWRVMLADGGNVERGRRVFFTERLSCIKCHTIGGRGGTLGPDLGRVAASKSRVQIVDAILDPSAEFTPQYQAWGVLTMDGQIVRGLQLDHKAGGAIVLTLEDGGLKEFAGDEIDDYFASPKSLMPDGLAESMTVGEFQDLAAYLSSLGD